MLSKRLNYMHTIRVAYENWIDSERFDALLELLKKYPCNIQSIALFTAATHAPLTPYEMDRRLEIIKKRLEQVRKCGFLGGINILATIGHHEEDLENSLGSKFTYMTNAAGDVCKGSYCMNDSSFLEEYVAPVYGMLVAANPDFIWVDDDIRTGHIPIGVGCFCKNCIDRFNRENNTEYTRDELVKKLDDCIETRKAWLRHNIDTIKNLFKFISKIVYEKNPDITLGFMTGERYAEGYAFGEFAKALSDGGKNKIMWRPGGGAYTDYLFDEIVAKGEEIGRQNAYLPRYVEIIQSEIENFPYQLLKKTPTSTALEAAWSMACGCTGAAFNILPSESNEPIENITEHLKAINDLKSFYILLENKIAGKKPIGISTAWSTDAQLSVPKGAYTYASGQMYANFARELFDFGLPQCYDPQNAFVNVVKGNAVSHWSDEKIKALLSRGVYMDAESLAVFKDRDFENLIGFKAEKEISTDAREKFITHFINENIVGGIRNCRQAFNFGDSVSLLPISDKAEILSTLTNYSDEILGSCSHGIFENSVGGRISVGGYYPFSWLLDFNKVTQLKRLMLWLSNNQLPSYVDSYCRIRNHTFKCENGYIIALLNPTNQKYSDLRVAVKTDKSESVCYTMDNSSYVIEGENSENSYRVFTIKELKPYEMAVIEV